jgi:hypothetical protein
LRKTATSSGANLSNYPYLTGALRLRGPTPEHHRPWTVRHGQNTYRFDDPEIFIQSPTLDILFANGAEMQAQIDVTDEGIVVIRTSTDPDVVAALHIHAAEVSDMADRGMQAVHDAMAQRADH